MKKFIHQSFMALADTLERATDEKGAAKRNANIWKTSWRKNEPYSEKVNTLGNLNIYTMKNKYVFIALFSMAAITLSAQHGEHATDTDDFNMWFSLLEIPFLIFVIVLSFIVANSLKGGKFGSGMSLLAWGFLVMAVGHAHMQVEHITGYNLFNDLFGNVGGKIAWFSALLVTWGLSALGFIKIYKASRI